MGRGQAKIDAASTYKNPDKYIKKYARSGKAALAVGSTMALSVVALVAAHNIAALAGYAKTLILVW